MPANYTDLMKKNSFYLWPLWFINKKWRYDFGEEDKVYYKLKMGLKHKHKNCCSSRSMKALSKLQSSQEHTLFG